MKVLYLITRPERGGAQMHVLDLISGLRQHCEIELACGDDKDRFLPEEAARLGVRCHCIPSLRQPIEPVSDARAFLEIRALLRRTRPDLVHAHTSKAGVLGRLAAWAQGIPAIFTAHTWCFAEGTSWKWKLFGVPLERLCGAVGGPIINVSEANRSLALKYRIAAPDRLVTVHNGIPDEAWQGPEPQTGPPTVIMVARFAPQKNQMMLLEAAAEIRQPFHLLFVGAGPTLGSVQNRATELGLTDRITFAGNRSDVPDLLRKSAIFALPTHWEGFPISTLEAMRAGLPVVASDVGGVREAVIDGENGFLTNPADTAAFRRALQLLLTDTDLRVQMAKKSRQFFEQRFTAERMLQKTFGLYRKAVPESAAEYKLPVLETGEQA
jgi:glycosyltransferase involved in cell wall biosynthesis